VRGRAIAEALDLLSWECSATIEVVLRPVDFDALVAAGEGEVEPGGGLRFQSRATASPATGSVVLVRPSDG
jgi:hypothetical protein